MPRIGGGGGNPIGGSGGPKGPKGTDFASHVQQAGAQGTDEARSDQAKRAKQAILNGKAKEVARRLQAGQLTHKEATREFVGLVVEERFPQLKRRKKKKKKRGDSDEAFSEDSVEDAVAELLDADPVLAERLKAQFRRLAEEDE